MRVKWEAVLTATLVMCALITTGLVVRREILPPSQASSQPVTRKPVFIQDWRSRLSQGVRLGSDDAPVQLVAFADFECPFCAAYHKVLNAVRQRYPTQVSLTYIHFPLRIHRFAVPAARVAECAGAQGRFEAMAEQLFEQQASLGLKPWSEYAQDAGVPDLQEFDGCVESTGPVPRLEAGRQLGEKLDVKGTPTLVVNGWMLAQPPSAEDLDAMVQAVLAGKSPVPAESVQSGAEER
jgi:protein-disulfide isomerase